MTQLEFDSKAEAVTSVNGFPYLSAPPQPSGTHASLSSNNNNKELHLFLDSLQALIGTRNATLKSDLERKKAEVWKAKTSSLDPNNPIAAVGDDGLFAWTMLVGYATFGEPFIVAARNRGINAHGTYYPYYPYKPY